MANTTYINSTEGNGTFWQEANRTVLLKRQSERNDTTSFVDSSSNVSMTSYSTSSLDHAHTIIQHVILPLICACGLLGLVLTLLVLCQKTMRTSTNCYLTALAVADLLFLLLLAPRLAENQFTVSSHRNSQVMNWITYFRNSLETHFFSLLFCPSSSDSVLIY